MRKDIIYRFAKPKSGAAKEYTGVRFSKIVLKLFGPKYFGALFWLVRFRKVFLKKPERGSELSSNILGICSVKRSSKGHSEG